MQVPFVDLGRSTAAHRPEIDAAVSRVLDSGWFVLGDEGRAFEGELAKYVGAEHAVGVASGTDAVELALRAVGVGPGDEVVTQANTCVPTVAGIAGSGATPVLCDVDPESGVIDPASLEGALSERTKAVVPVHLYGQCADVEEIAAICEPRGIVVVEDCAQAIGATVRGRAAGTIGAAGAFSFYPTKNLGAIGDGGAVVTGDAAAAERLRSLRVYGQSDRYRHEIEGVNSRLDEMQAAILRAKLPHLDGWTERRRAIAARYDEALAGGGLAPLSALPDRRHVFHLYVVQAEERDAAIEALREAGVVTLIHYPVPVHLQPAYQRLAGGPVPLANSERFCARILSLPMFPELTDAEVDHVCESLLALAR